jgi:hypothetical protein
MPLEGEIVNLCHRSIRRMPSDRNLLSLYASLAIPTCVLRFEVSRLRRRTPARPVLLTGQTGQTHRSDRSDPSVLALWINQGTQWFCGDQPDTPRTQCSLRQSPLMTRLLHSPGSTLVFEGRIRRTREGGSEWEPIKNLLEGDGDSNKTNTTSNTRTRLTTHVGQAHVATGVPLDLGTNKQPSEPKHTNTHSVNLQDFLPVLHRSDQWTEPVRPVAAATAQQVFQKALVTSLGPGTKTP